MAFIYNTGDTMTFVGSMDLWVELQKAVAEYIIYLNELETN